MNRPSSSRRPRRRNISPAASRWCRPRSGTWCAITVNSKASRSPAMRRLRRRCEKALELGSDRGGEWLAEADLLLSATQLGHDPGADGGPDRPKCSAPRAGQHSAGHAGGSGMTDVPSIRGDALRLSDRRRRLCRLGARRAAGEPAWRARPADRPARPCRRQRLRRARRGRHPLSQIRPAHLPHQQRPGGRLSVAVHRVAAVRAPRAGAGARAAGADPDQPHDA